MKSQRVLPARTGNTGGGMPKINYLSHNWLILRIVSRYVTQALRQYARGSLLDVGCGDKPYAEVIKALPAVTSHTGLDRKDSPHTGKDVSIEIESDVYNIRECDKYDTILCTQVFEHLEEPENALLAMNRALREDGILLLSTNFIWHIHEQPRDFFRYTKFGLQYLVEKAGFKLIEVKAMTGFWVTFGQELAYYIYKFGSISLLKPVVFVLVQTIQIASLILEKIDKDESYTANYLVVAKK